jgi:hypothetical protein
MTSVWETILQLPALPRGAHEGDEVRSGDLPLLTGRIRIAGAWEGTVALIGPRPFAAKCAAIMHGCQPETVTEAEVRDGWRELVNIVGGNLKALVPGLRVRRGGSRVLNDMVFACLGQRVRLTVLQPRRSLVGAVFAIEQASDFRGQVVLGERLGEEWRAGLEQSAPEHLRREARHVQDRLPRPALLHQPA